MDLELPKAFVSQTKVDLECSKSLQKPLKEALSVLMLCAPSNHQLAAKFLVSYKNGGLKYFCVLSVIFL